MDVHSVAHEIAESYRFRIIAFHVGAGISHDPPSNLPLGKGLVAAIISGFSELLDLSESELLNRSLAGGCSLEEVCGLIQHELSVPRKLIEAMANALDNDALAPNRNHLMLARALHDGHIVTTTNFDSLIERAYKILYGVDFPTHRIYYDDATFHDLDFVGFKPGTNGGEGWLLKLHGSFRIGTIATGDSVMTTLQRVGKNLSPSAEKGLRMVLQNCPVVVLGYGGVDIDIVYPVLVGTESAETMWWVKHGAEETVEPYTALADRMAGEEKKLSKGEPVDIGMTNVLRVLRSRASKAMPHKAWLIRTDTNRVMNEMSLAVGRDVSVGVTADSALHSYWERTLHDFGVGCSNIEKLMFLGKLTQVLAIRRIPSVGEPLPDANTMYNLSDKLFNLALGRADNVVKARVYRELGWNQYRRNPEANAGSSIELYAKASDLLPSRSADPFVLGLVSLARLRARQISEAATAAQAAWNALPATIRKLVSSADLEGTLVESTSPEIASLDYVATSSIMRRIAAVFSGYVAGSATLSTAIGFGHVWLIDDRERKLLERTRQLAEVARVLSRRSGERREQIQAENFLGLICSKLDDGAAAIEAHEASRHTAEQFGWYPELPQALRNLGLAYEIAGRLDDAVTTLETARRLFSDAERKEDTITTQWHKGRIKIKAGQPEGADNVENHLEAIKETRLDIWHWRANDKCLLGIASWDILGDKWAGAEYFESMAKEYDTSEGMVDFSAQSYGVDNALANVLSVLGRLSKEPSNMYGNLMSQLVSLRDHLSELRKIELLNIPSLSSG